MRWPHPSTDAAPTGSAWRTTCTVSLSREASARGFPGILLEEGTPMLSIGREGDWIRFLGGGTTGWIPLWSLHVVAAREG